MSRLWSNGRFTRGGDIGGRKKLEILVKTSLVKMGINRARLSITVAPMAEIRSSAYEIDSDRSATENRSLRTMSCA